jgi:hypothetical protein
MPIEASTSPERAIAVHTLPWSSKSVFLVCLAYSNLCFANAWQQLESRHYDYFLRPPVRLEVGLRYCGALLTDVFLLALILWGIYIWLSRSSISYAPRIVAIGFIGLLAIPLNLLRIEKGLFRLGNPVVLAALVVAAVSIFIWHKVMIRPTAILVMLSWPLLPILLLSSLQHVLGEVGYSEPRMADRLPGVAPRRLIWVIFDELDEHWAFDARPAGVDLPKLDAFRSESFSATHVHRVAVDTLEAVPSLLLGRAVRNATLTGPVGLNLTFQDGNKQAYPFQENIFSLARGRGINAAAVGWYHPYCRLFHDSLTDCVWAPAESAVKSIFVSLDPTFTRSFSQALVTFATNLIAGFPATDRLGLKFRPIGYVPDKARAMHQIAEFRSIYEAGLKFSVDPSLGFVYLHFPVPHTYGIYDAGKRMMRPGGNYFDNLTLADKTLGDLRAALEGAHLWDSTSVLVSADHSLRYHGDISSPKFLPSGSEVPLVPFLLKFPAQRTALYYEPAFNAVVTRDLVLAILSGEVSTASEAAQWLDRNKR